MDLSIIIVNFNTFTITSNCLRSIYEATGPVLRFEIILVDNGSKDQPPIHFKKEFPDITLIEAGENLGFGKANNRGMQVARGRYFLLLNSDTIVLPGALEKCFAYMEANPTVGLLGCKLLNPDRSLQPSIFPYLKNTLWTFFKTINPLALKLLQLARADKHRTFDYTRIQPVGDVSGAFMFMRSSIARDTGYFDTDFFMYCEDTEWCRERIAPRTTILYYPEASIVHLGGQSAPKELMYIQSRLSLSLMWYKKGWLSYTGYIIASYLSAFTILITWPLYNDNSKPALKAFLKACKAIFPQLFNDIPRYPRRLNARTKKLVYTKARKVMNLAD